MFKESRPFIREDIWIVADKGYKGIRKFHSFSLIPIKSSKSRKLNDVEKAFNISLAKRRIFIEHINRYLKRFRIISSRYRNKHRRFSIRFSLICALYNKLHHF